MTHEEILRRSIEEGRSCVDPLLEVALSIAVPLWIDRARSWTTDERQAKARASSHVIAYGRGAAFMATAGKERGRGKPGEVAQVFNSVACGLALLSYCPGGVTWGGQHWETPG